MTKLLRYMKGREWLFFLVSLVFIISQVWLDLKLPDYMSEITTLVETEGSAMADIWASGGKMLLCSLGSLASSIMVCYLASSIAASFSRRLRAAMFDKVESFSMEEINSFSTASLITRSTNDVVQVQMLIVLSMQVVIKAPAMAIWAITKIAGKAWQWSLATGIAIVLLVGFLAIAMVLTFPKFRKIQWLQDALNHAARENLSGIRVVRAYNAEEYQERKFEKANTDLLKNQLFANRTMTLLSPFMNITMNCLNMSIYWIGAVLINAVVIENAASIATRVDIFADMIVFMSYAMQVIMSFIMIVMVFIVAPRALVAAKRINEVLETEPKIVDSAKPQPEETCVGEVEFRNVSFTYPGGSGNVLTDISFTAHRGETVAFIGSTGSGKTTLVNLIPRFYDVTEGAVLVDGVDVRDYELEKLYKKLSYVSQRAVMFSGDIEDNVAFGANADRAKLRDALHISQSEEFVDGLEDGVKSHVAQGGTNFSGGQKQRLSIARALCRDAEILIFDDTFSALDFKTDRELRDALKAKTENETKLIVAQRIGTIMSADKIIVLDEGRQVGTGTHQELMKNCEVYRQIALSQLSEEELAI
ncbi:aBC-type multidrug transport system ATPase and permease components [Firmicutes bacterium CAG:555]|nr:aBC-type multidrug transport system ATPase and permease components [Firmicutes bacterium CAG:555]